MHYYNEWDPYCIAWLRNLMREGLIPRGVVDTRSIVDVRPTDLLGFTQCHFFAGIGGWALAARLAGWSNDRPLWTASCPCQPFSHAGKGAAQADERHLWPEVHRLASAARPPVIVGEQVAAAVGRDWLDGVRADLEGLGYAVGAVVVPACAVDAPHRRDRLWFVAESRDLPNASEQGLSSRERGRERERIAEYGDVEGARGPVADGPSAGRPWRGAEWAQGGDGKIRRVKPGLPLLAHGVPNRVGRLRAYGNAIVPQVAAEVLGAYLDTRPL